MERIHISTIFYFLKTKCPKIVSPDRIAMIDVHSAPFQDICCISGSRAEDIYNLARFAKVSIPTPKKIPFTLGTTDLYVMLL